MIKTNNKNKNGSRSTLVFHCNVTLLVFILLLFLAHLITANHTATQSYEINEYREQRKALLAENQKLNLHVIELRSSERLLAESKRLNFVTTDTVRYISPKTSIALGD